MSILWNFVGVIYTCGLYYKPITIVNDDSRVINKLETSLTDNARVINHDGHMFIVQATEGVFPMILTEVTAVMA